jgi:hypothetical protein
MITASGTAAVWSVGWLIGDEGRAYANKVNPALNLKPLNEVVCDEKLVGNEHIVRDEETGEVIERLSVRRISQGDVDAIPLLRPYLGEDVCAWKPHPVDAFLTWLLGAGGP